MSTDNTIILKNEIISLLREGKKDSHIGLPDDIDFSIQNGLLKVCVRRPTLNMQSNGAAFEGWIVALKASLSAKVNKVELDYREPSNYSANRLGNPEACHFNRFVYRIYNFSRLFPEWFNLASSKSEQVSEFMSWLKQGPCYLNHSLQERQSVIETEKQERKIESWFTFGDGKKSLCELWGLDMSRLFNQLPIGVFYQTINRGQAVFTRGAGAIDLWGISKDGNDLHIIELKCGNNIRMGVISEVLFYTAVLYDTCVAQNNLFKFGKYKNSSETTDMLAVQSRDHFNKLHSHILAEKFHPLFSDGVMSLLKKGLSKLDIAFDRAIYNYENNKPPKSFP